MLDLLQVKNSLENKKKEFFSYNDLYSLTIQDLKACLDEMIKVSAEQVAKKLSSIDYPGALPLKEWNENGICRPFEETFTSQEKARGWAHNVLLYKTTFSADGSQILPTKDIYPPIAAVQVCCFENFHTPDGNYNKTLDFDLITPVELESNEIGFQKEDQLVNYRRFALEVDKTIEYIHEKMFLSPKPLIFFDGSLILSFITAEGATAGGNKKAYDAYITKIIELLSLCDQTKTPIISYIDTSNARDLVDMVKNYTDPSTTPNIVDSKLLDEYLTHWGDRTPAFLCKRSGILNNYKAFKDQICFLYIKLNSNSPVRLEFPRWMIEETTDFESMINIVRAESIIGNGYIYAIESADACAVISNADKERFYKMFFEFSNMYKFNVSYAQKALSKRRRR